jgi:heme A synthase
VKPAAVALVLTLLAARSGSAHEEAAPAPSPAWPVVGLAVALGGAAVSFQQARRASNGEEGCVKVDGGCFWLTQAGTVMEEAGGALLALWGWRLGEHDRAADRAAGRPPRDVDGRRVFGLIAGGVALAALYTGTVVAAFAPLGCVDGVDGDNQEYYHCAARAQWKGQLVALSAVPVLLVAAPVVSYAFGYQAADRSRAAVTLAPRLAPDRLGLDLVGRF